MRARWRRSGRYAVLVISLLVAAWLNVARSGSAVAADSGATISGLHVGGGRFRGVATDGDDLSLRWTARHLDGSDLAIELSGDGGVTWSGVGLVPATAGRYDWRVDAPSGPVSLRLVAVDKPAVSRRLHVRIVPGVEDVSYALGFAVSLQTDGTVRIWGQPPEGLAPEQHTVIFEPIPLPGFSEIVALSAGGTHLLAVRQDGSVVQWGDFDGVGNPAPAEFTPMPIEGITDAEFVRARFWTSFARLRDGRVFAWGKNYYGNLGDGTDTSRTLPVEIPGLLGVTDIALGEWFGLALSSDGDVLTWGDNAAGVLGDGSTAGRFDPAPVPGLHDVVAIATAFDHAMALTRGGKVYSWGRDHLLQLGRDAPGVEGVPGAASTAPAEVAGLEDIVAIACDVSGGHALRGDGVLFGWGSNSVGTVGDGTTLPRARPVVALLAGATRIYGGFTQTVCAFRTDGTRYAWGGDSSGLMGNGRRRYGSARPIRVRTDRREVRLLRSSN